jgi:hypothetical protein
MGICLTHTWRGTEGGLGHGDLPHTHMERARAWSVSLSNASHTTRLHSAVPHTHRRARDGPSASATLAMPPPTHLVNLSVGMGTHGEG